MRVNRWLGVLLAVFLVAVSACGGGDETGSRKDSASGKEAAGSATGKAAPGAAGAEPDVEGLPEVLAEVNGEQITKDEFVQTYGLQFQRMAQQAEASGQQVDQDRLKEQVLETMVNTELLVQEATARNVSVSDGDVDKTLEGLARQNGLDSTDALLAALEKQGLDRAEVESQVRTQLMMDRLVTDEAGDIAPSEKEVRALYEQMVAQQEQAAGNGDDGAQSQVPPLKQVRAQLSQQLESQERSKVAEALVTELRKDADLDIRL